MIDEVTNAEKVETDLDRFIGRRAAWVHEECQAATAKRLQAVDEENEARFQWTNALRRIENREGYAKSISREIRALQGEG